MKNKGLIVRMEGLEPPRLTAPDPKSGAAAITPHPAVKPYLPVMEYGKKERKFRDNSELKNSFLLFKWYV